MRDVIAARLCSLRRVLRWTFIGVLVSGVILGCWSSGEQAEISVGPDGSIVRNGSFEDQGQGAVPGWTVERRAAHKGEISVVQTKAHSGLFGLKLTPNKSNSPSDLAHNPLGIGQGFPAGPLRGKKMYISAWLAAEGGAVAVVGLYALRTDGGAAFVRIEQTSSNPGLVFHQDVLVVPDDKQIQHLVLICIVEGMEGAAYFDDVFVSTQVPLEWMAASGKVDPGPPLSADVMVDADHVIRKIPSTLYGTNVEWIWDGNGLWDSKKQTLNSELVRLTRELKVSLIRFPGGIFADFYHWRDAIGPQTSRRETPHMPGSSKSVHRFGTDEALAFVRQTEGQLMITANIITGTPQEAAEWVRYVNKTGTAGTNGRRVEYWELGNETYVKEDSPHSRVSTMPPQKYAARFLEFAQAMREVDPTIKIGAISDENYGKYAPHSYPNWTEEVLTRAGSKIDFLSVHNAYAPAISEDKGWRVRSVYEAMLAAPVLIKASLERLSQKIETLVPDRASHIKIAVSEWGPYFHVSPQSRFVDHVKTLASALYVASTLKIFLESPRTEIANFFQLADSLFMGWIGPRDGAYIPKAPYFALQMYTKYFGNMLVRSSTTSPTYDSTPVGWVDPVSKVPYLDVVASRSDNGTLYVMAINKHFDRPINAKITIRGLRLASNGTAWTLTGTNIDANTGTELFQAPRMSWQRQAGAEPNPHFHLGKPSEVGITSAPVSNVATTFEYTFPPHSVTSLELQPAIGPRRGLSTLNVP
jgi:alpha-N-arabinofuranosidase